MKLPRLKVLLQLLALTALLPLLSGCSVVRFFKHIAYDPKPEPGSMRTETPHFEPDPERPADMSGSLWASDTQWSWFADDKALRKGDVVKVIVDQENEGVKDASTETSRVSKITASLRKLFGEEEDIQDPAGDPLLIDAETSNEFEGEGTTERKDDMQATVSAIVMDVTTNGNLVIYGHQVVQVNREASVLTVQGIIRPSDISADNTIESSRLANAIIEFDGSGVVSDKQGPGWGVRLFDWIWPL